MGWPVETLDEIVKAKVEALPVDMKARLARVAGLIESEGLKHVGAPHVRHFGAGALGSQAARPKWHIACPLCDSQGATGTVANISQVV